MFPAQIFPAQIFPAQIFPAQVFPAYDGGSLVNLIASITDGLGSRPRHAPLDALPAQELRAARSIVLFVVDGLGERQLNQHLADGHLMAARRGAITSVFPPTTASAITTSYTGATPLEHGLTGWHTYFSQAACTAAPLPMRRRGDDVPLGALGLAASRAFPQPSFFDALPVPTTVVTDKRIVESEYNRHHCGRAAKLAYDKLDALVELTVQSVKAGTGRKLVYVYWPEVDSASHRYGPSSKEALTRAREVDAAFGQLRERLAGTDSVLIMTADHGFAETPPESALAMEAMPELASLLRLPLCGEPRTAFCYVQAGRVNEFIARARDWVGERADVRPSRELVEEGWFGPGDAHPLFAERVGDVTLVLHGNHTVKDWVAGEKRYVLHGNHGGTSADEMLVPLVVANC